MLILQMFLIGAACGLLLIIHRAGVAHSLRAIGAVFYSAADGVEYGKKCFGEAMEMARQNGERA